MNWFEQQRQLWIAETLFVFGFINRSHLMRKFRISMAKASEDLRKYQRTYPGAMVYDPNKKHYKVGP